MSIFDMEIKRSSTQCHRGSHQNCKNSKDNCGCDCHVKYKRKMMELERRLREAFAASTHVQVLSG